MVTPEHTGSPTKKANRIYWLRLAFTLFVVIILSYGLSYLIQHFIVKPNVQRYEYAWLVYFVMFGISVLVNLTIIVPVPIAISTMIAAATRWNPLLLALAASTGGTIGELSGYYAGYLGKKIAIPEEVIGYRRYERWIQRYGVWAIFFLAIQPILPFDIGGFIAGAARMPMRKFLPALWLGKSIKYIIFAYVGKEIINFLPFTIH
jgi:uncharacterized membrane protein YdjX (TVP38/TMEM64 family)